LTGTSLSLGGCITNLPNCVFKGESLSFETQKGTLLEESDKAKVRLEPASGTTMLVATFEPGCSLGSSWVFTGILEATQNSSKLGYYAFLPTGLKFGKQSVEIKGEFTLSTPPNHALSAIAGALGGGPRWHLSPEEWTTIPTGVSTSFINEAPFLYSFSTTIGGSPVNVTCGEYGNYVAGTVENPAGGSAGTASGLFTFQACETNVKTCIIESAGSPGYLEGVAMEASGAPAVQWSPSSGTALLVFNMKPGCFAGSVIALTGKLITTSEGDGRFSLANSELRVGKQKATASSEFTLETGASGEYLRLQP
jgi:hypothetical protein